MEFSLSTFILEVLNFLVLLWILKRLLYKPLLEIITTRQEKIKGMINESKKKLQEAKSLEQEYQSRLEKWEIEKEEKKSLLNHELNFLREEKLGEIKIELENTREKFKVQAEKAKAAEIERIEKTSLDVAYVSLSKLLEAVSCSEMEEKLINLSLSHLEKDDTLYKKLKELKNVKELNINIKTAFSHSQDFKNNIVKVLEKKIPLQVNVNFAISEDMIAGAEFEFKEFSIKANLKEELKYFWSHP
ncbi:hypothetical protein ACRXCV_10240 [Halobacteriovorax sp. GFR7]|uniref:F0F1 ATP synthase subunit B family protein n=1 Tax=unclassified Halobacteriovorax TaxID=2639665 RepID=UPI003D964597